jgi:GT2 family glycosyltransferase
MGRRSVRSSPPARAAAVVVNHNGGEDLPNCLDALRAQTVEVAIVLVDCASTDGSAAWAEAPSEGVVGVPLAENLGYAGGCEEGLAACGAADVVGFFNPDCFPAPDLFARCLEVMDGDPAVGGVAPRLERPDGVHLDSCGQRLTRWLLRVRDRGYGEVANGAYFEPGRVLAACGAGMVYRRAALEAAAVEGAVFPREYFAFWEDLDLGWRVSNAGWRVVYAPLAVAVHRRAGTARAGRGRLIFRRRPELAACILLNRWATLARNLHTIDFAVRLPLLLAADVMMVAVVIARKPAALPPLLRGVGRLRLAVRQRRRLPRRRLRELQ